MLLRIGFPWWIWSGCWKIWLVSGGILKERCDQAQKEYDAADRNHLEKRDAYTAGVQLLKRFDELNRQNRSWQPAPLRRIRSERPKKRFSGSEGAYEIQAVFQRYMDAVRTAESTRKNLSEQETAIPALIETGKEAEREAEAGQKNGLRLEIRNFTQVSERVQKSLEIFSKIRQAKEQASLAQEECRRTEQEAKDAQKKMQALEEKRTSVAQSGGSPFPGRDQP